MRRRQVIRHKPIADSLRADPGSWGEIGKYRWLSYGKSAAHRIRTGSLPAYQPAGAFETEIRRDDEGDCHVYARYNPEGAAR